MYLLFEPFVVEVLDKFRPKNILEIGVLNGGNTIRLLNWCAKNPDTHLASIDPAGWSGDLPPEIAAGHPDFNCPDAPFPAPFLEEAYSKGLFKHWTCIKGYSVSEIPKLQGKIDLAIIDGDHNYYTVANELRLLEPKLADNAVVLFHDVVGLWNRLDSYYDISNIPETYRHGAKQGVVTAIDEFLDLHNGRRVGEFAAIESFIESYNRQSKHVTIFKDRLLDAARVLIKGRRRVTLTQDDWDRLDKNRHSGAKNTNYTFEILSTRDYGVGMLRKVGHQVVDR
jgi:hypothetical protein